MDEEIFLNDIWNLYFHDPKDNDWTFQSYKLLGNISSVQMFLNVHHLLKDHWCKGMFFLMREHVFPCWDNEYNKSGGCLSMKILKNQLPMFWEYISIRLLGETLSKNNAWEIINGISTSPKTHYCIIKIWLKEPIEFSKSDFDIPSFYNGEIQFKLNMDNLNR